MKKILLGIVLVTACAAWSSARADGGAHQFGIGAHYWQTVDNLNAHHVDEDGISWLATYQYRPGILGLGIDVERLEKGFAGSDKDVYEPQAYLIVGHGLYGAAGIGGYYTDGDLANDPFYFFRAGFDIELLPSIHLDLHGIYRFEQWSDLHDDNANVDSDTITLGAAVRVAL